MNTEAGKVEQFLTFKLSDKVFGIPINSVTEILEYQTVQEVPMMPEFILGAINLRGNIINVINLSNRLGAEAKEIDKYTCTIIVEANLHGNQFFIGLKVDSVHHVAEFQESQIDKAPAMGGQINTDFIYGMAKNDDNFTILLDVERLLTYRELEVLQQPSTPQLEGNI